jgi:DNA-binding transcriptional LysR family regulator
MPVDHRGLNAFLHVARMGSVGAAASALSLTQPAVSRTLRKLENQLGVQLFLRHSTGMELTAFGQSLLPHATLLESGLHRALEEIDLMRGASKGVARVGILPSLVPDILPHVVNNVRTKSPGIQLHIVEAPNHQLARSLLRGEIDFAIAAVPPDSMDENIRATTLVNDEICIVARATHPIMKVKWPGPQHLCEYDWALQERGGAIWRNFQTLFANASLEMPVVSLTSNSIQTLKSVIMSTDLLTMLPRISIRNEEKGGILRPVPIRSARWRRQLAVLRRIKGPMLPSVNMVLAEFRKALTAASEKTSR